MTSKIYFFATFLEAAKTIEKLQAIPVCENIWSFNKGRLVITGMGRDAVLNFVEGQNFLQILASSDLVNAVWVNIGIAGAFSETYAVGQYVCVHSTSFLQDKVKKSFILREEPGAHLYTSLVPVYATPENIKKESLIDMEGYFLAEVAKKCGFQLYMGKIVSDHCSSESSSLIKKRIGELSQIIALAIDPRHPSGLLSCH